MVDTPAELDAWAKKLTDALHLPDDVEVDISAVLDLARAFETARVLPAAEQA